MIIYKDEIVSQNTSDEQYPNQNRPLGITIEELSLNALPALQTVLYDGWIILPMVIPNGRIP